MQLKHIGLSKTSLHVSYESLQILHDRDKGTTNDWLFHREGWSRIKMWLFFCIFLNWATNLSYFL